MKVLGIETSCDETSAAIVDEHAVVHSLVIASSQEDFSSAGGVIPEDAARKQIVCMMPVIEQCLNQANMKLSETDLIAVTAGPGLFGSLLVGTTCARTLSSVSGIPVTGVHHTLGHLFSSSLRWKGDDITQMNFPVLTLSVSGGHTDIWLRTSPLEGDLIGGTRDDAAGEAYDKGAKILGLPYPGGPSVSRASKDGDSHRFTFPVPFKHDDEICFSFSGLKTSLKYLIRDNTDTMDKQWICDAAASYQHAINAHLCDGIRKAIESHPEVRQIHTVGGVSANEALRSMIHERFGDREIVFPDMKFCTDNAAMIAIAGLHLYEKNGAKEFVTSTSEPLSKVLS